MVLITYIKHAKITNSIMRDILKNYLKEDERMSDTTNKEIMTMEELEENEVEKVGILTKVKGFCKNHKKALIIGGAVATAAGVLIKVISKAGADVEDEYEGDYIESEAEVIEDDSDDDIEDVE